MPIDRRKFIRDSSLVLSAGVMGVTGCSESSEDSAGHDVSPKEVELLASYWTIAGDVNPATGGREWSLFDFRDRVETISKVGFKGMGIWHADLEHILETRSLAEMKKILDDNGIVHVELEFLLDWFMDGELRQQSDLQRAKLLAAAEALGARHVKVGDFFNRDVAKDKVAESFADLCRDGANAGTRIVFEVMPFSMIDNLPGALAMLDAAGASNGGLILDTWHVVKMGTPFEQVAAVPPQYLLGIELNDGFLQTPEGVTLNQETVEYRQFCGEGEFDMPAYMAAIEASAYDGPVGVEVINVKNRSRSLDELAERAYRTSMAMFA
jgi:sugar phosphate isomerase/epimerase